MCGLSAIMLPPRGKVFAARYPPFVIPAKAGIHPRPHTHYARITSNWYQLYAIVPHSAVFSFP